MQNRYSLWKYWLIVLIVVVSVIYALPNVFGEDPAVQINAGQTKAPLDEKVTKQLISTLKQANLKYKSVELGDESLLFRFYDADTELKANDLIKAKLGTDYTVAATIAPATPQWLEAIGAYPMKYGLDLRGGVHFLMDIDVDGVVAKRVTGIIKSVGEDLRRQRIRYSGLVRLKNNNILMSFRNQQSRDAAYSLLKSNYPNLLLSKRNRVGGRRGQFRIIAQLSPATLATSREYTIEQAMTILRNRVNELGIGEAVVQRQGANRIAVDLPGIQDAARAKQIIRGTATLEFRLVDDTPGAAQTAQSTGVIPLGTKLYEWQERPVLLKNQIILSGSSITNAQSTLDQQSGTPSVQIQLGGGGESLFSRATRENVGKPMAIVYVEVKMEPKIVDGKATRVARKTERVISVATINQALHTNFIIMGLTDMNEARNLALFLRAGALPAAIYPVEERLVGPTLGLENIKRGMVSLAVGLGLILLIMLLYYRMFGLFANIALVLNLTLLVAILSLLGAAMSLPGIAGLVLTVGMAVDTNVLIFERIREELRHGMTPQAAIFAGYERAFSTIIDANVTTLIVVIVLYAIGTGPVQGFAVVTSIGLMTSMITGIFFTRAMVNLYYGRRRSVKKLSIGTIKGLPEQTGVSA